MSVVAIKAFIECDACGHRFAVALDPARSGGSVWDAAEEAVAAGHTIGEEETCSALDGAMLCADCTAVADAVPAN